MFNDKNPESEQYLMFLDPERFRYHYMVEFIHTNRAHFYQIVSNEEKQVYDQDMRGTETLGRGTRGTMQRGTERQSDRPIARPKEEPKPVKSKNAPPVKQLSNQRPRDSFASQRERYSQMSEQLSKAKQPVKQEPPKKKKKEPVEVVQSI